MSRSTAFSFGENDPLLDIFSELAKASGVSNGTLEFTIHSSHLATYTSKHSHKIVCNQLQAAPPRCRCSSGEHECAAIERYRVQLEEELPRRFGDFGRLKVRVKKGRPVKLGWEVHLRPAF